MGLVNYSGPQRFIESLMVDTCQITRDPEQQFDETLDLITGELVVPDPDYFIIYRGNCLIRSQRSQDSEIEGLPISLSTYRVLIPISVTNVRFNDILQVIEATHDSALEGTRMKVVQVDKGTHSVYRALDCQDVTEAQPQ